MNYELCTAKDYALCTMNYQLSTNIPLTKLNNLHIFS